MGASVHVSMKYGNDEIERIRRGPSSGYVWFDLLAIVIEHGSIYVLSWCVGSFFDPSIDGLLLFVFCSFLSCLLHKATHARFCKRKNNASRLCH